MMKSYRSYTIVVFEKVREPRRDFGVKMFACVCIYHHTRGAISERRQFKQPMAATQNSTVELISHQGESDRNRSLHEPAESLLVLEGFSSRSVTEQLRSRCSVENQNKLPGSGEVRDGKLTVAHSTKYLQSPPGEG